MWYKAYTFININNLKEDVFILNGEVKRKKKKELKYLDVLTNLDYLNFSLNHKQFINTHFPYFKAENSIYMKDINNHRIQ